jgi:Ca-activated chloride channel family protein
VVDAHLLAHLLHDGGPGRDGWRTWLPQVVFALAAALALLALAGPSWREVPQPLLQDRNPLVIAVDMSSATNAADVAPSRLLQARDKIARILRRRTGQIALIAFADDAYTVSPLTDDSGNIALFLDALSPEVMPRDGSRADRAIEESVRLLKRAGFARGDILLITDRAGGSANSAAIDARAAGYRVSVLGLGATTGGQYLRRNGDAVTARLQVPALRALAISGGGDYASFAPGDADLETLGALSADRIDAAASDGKRGRGRLDEGFWLLPPLMLLALFAFRRGGLALMLLGLWLPWQPVHAADLWRRADQREHAAMTRGVEAYRSGDYAGAESAWRDLPGADAAYNRGNAMAKQGRYDEAIAEYRRALQLQPGLRDAAENLRRVDAARKRLPPPPPKSRPSKTDQRNPEQSKPEQSKPEQSKPEQSKPEQSKPEQSKPEQSKPDQSKPEQSKPEQSKPEESKPEQSKPEQSKPEQSKPAQPNAGQPDPAQQRPEARRPVQPAAQSGQEQPAKAMPDGTPSPTDAEALKRLQEARAAEAAERERRARAQGKTPAPQNGNVPRPQETAAQRERRIANEAWLRRVPDDPGGLLRAKFKLEEKRRRREGDR